jgi:hypothetical protein
MRTGDMILEISTEDLSELVIQLNWLWDNHPHPEVEAHIRKIDRLLQKSLKWEPRIKTVDTSDKSP